MRVPDAPDPRAAGVEALRWRMGFADDNDAEARAERKLIRRLIIKEAVRGKDD